MVNMAEVRDIERRAIIAAERRRSDRMAICQGVTVLRDDGSVLARGRTSNLSPKGTLVISRIQGELPRIGDAVVVELTVPSSSSSPSKVRMNRTVRQKARIVRTTRLGQLAGLGIEFVLA